MPEENSNSIFSTQVCSKCKMEQPLENYRKNPSNKRTGRQSECKNCNDERARNYYSKNKKSIIKSVLKNRKNKTKLLLEISRLEQEIDKEKEIAQTLV